jgi:hypothetical protein
MAVHPSLPASAPGALRVPTGPGTPAAPGHTCLELLPSGPDSVRRAPSRRTRPLTPELPRLPRASAVADGNSARHKGDFRFRVPLAPRLARPPKSICKAQHVLHGYVVACRIGAEEAGVCGPDETGGRGLEEEAGGRGLEEEAGGRGPVDGCQRGCQRGSYRGSRPHVALRAPIPYVTGMVVSYVAEGAPITPLQ